MKPHHRHFFEGELRCVGKVTHLRLNVFPDGGVARLRAYGEVEPPLNQKLIELNAASSQAAQELLKSFCGSELWASQVAAERPFEDAAALYRIAERAFWQLDETALLQAFAAHPRIGERTQNPEQSGVQDAQRQELAALNEQYLSKHGFIFLVCATGRSGEEMLQSLRTRLANPTSAELRTAAEEQAKILRLRIERYLE
jgi:allantoicase